MVWQHAFCVVVEKFCYETSACEKLTVMNLFNVLWLVVLHQHAFLRACRSGLYDSVLLGVFILQHHPGMGIMVLL